MNTTRTHLILITVAAVLSAGTVCALNTNPDGASLVLPLADTWSGASILNADGAHLRAVGMYYEGGDHINADNAWLRLSPLMTLEIAPVPHPADLNEDFAMVINEAIAYLAGWQQGSNPIAYAIRAAYLWQNGEDYVYLPEEAPPLCWELVDE